MRFKDWTHLAHTSIKPPLLAAGSRDFASVSGVTLAMWSVQRQGGKITASSRACGDSLVSSRSCSCSTDAGAPARRGTMSAELTETHADNGGSAEQLSVPFVASDPLTVEEVLPCCGAS